MSLDIDDDVQDQHVLDAHEMAASESKPKRFRRSIKSFAYSQCEITAPSQLDPLFDFHLPLILNGNKERHHLHDWQVMRTRNGQQYLIGRTKLGCDFSGPLVGFSYSSLVAMDDENLVYVLIGKPRLRDDLEDWRFYCSMSGIESDQSIDISPQVWRLALAMNGKLVKESKD